MIQHRCEHQRASDTIQQKCWDSSEAAELTISRAVRTVVHAFRGGRPGGQRGACDAAAPNCTSPARFTIRYRVARAYRPIIRYLITVGRYTITHLRHVR